MSRLGAVLVFAALAAFGAGAFALDPPYQWWALGGGAACLAIGVFMEIVYNSVLETYALDDASEPLIVPGPEFGLGANILGPDAWPQSWQKTPVP